MTSEPSFGIDGSKDHSQYIMIFNYNDLHWNFLRPSVFQGYFRKAYGK